MNPGRFQRIEALFDAACELPPDQRGALLDRECADDPSLRAEVESLLAFAPGSARQIGSIVGREASRVAAERDIAPVARRIGAYRLERELGMGGMGAVYLAIRDDDAYRTAVAIKLLHHGLETAYAVARFRDERQILATLEHPGIVRLLDGGSTDQRLPYLVMEYIEGTPITAWADAGGLGVTARVALLRRVCAAVAYAHQKLVVHRDIKPSNILVTREGAPKLLDFGIAKLIDPAADAGREARTRTGMHLLTPEYASPEQVRGEPASTATDVYSLGAVLYELLVGATAHGLAGAASEADPPRPSAVAPLARRRALAGDLDNIVLKALHRDPARRYASVEQLSDDLGRHLDGQPVLARPATLGYRAGKLLRRNRGAVAAILIVFAALTAATTVSIRQARRADEHALRADEAARRAQRRFDDVRRLTNSMLFEVDERIQRLEGATAAREVLVSRALEYLDGLADEAGYDPALSRELAAAYVKIGDIEGSTLGPNLGRPQDALISYAKARRILEGLIAAGDHDAAIRWALARTLHRTGVVEWAERSHAPARASIAAAIDLVEASPRDDQFDDELATILRVKGIELAVNVGDLAAAHRHAEACLAVATRRAAATADPEARYWAGVAHEGSVLRWSYAGDPEAAIRDLDEAAAIFAALASEHPQHVAYRREHWSALYLGASFRAGVGNAMIWQPSTGDRPAAEALLREALGLAQRLVERDPDDHRAAAELAYTLDLLAATIADRDPAAALSLFQRAREVVAALPDAARASAYVGQFEWYGQCAMAEPLARLGRRDEAIAAATRGLALASHAAGADSLEARLSPSLCRYLAARAHRSLGDDVTATGLLAQTVIELRAVMAAFPAILSPCLGFTAALELLAAIDPARRCEHLGRAADAWTTWPGAPTAFTGRRLAALTSARAGCPRP